MIISASEYKGFNPDLTISDDELEEKLKALEQLVRKYTNNNFQVRAVRFLGKVTDSIIYGNIPTGLKVGDTIEISQSGINDGLYTVAEVNVNNITVSEEIYDQSQFFTVTKVSYPPDVKHGVIDMIRWKLDSGNKVGIQSETISRHSVTYFNMDGENSIMGYPKSLLGFLKPYRKART